MHPIRRQQMDDVLRMLDKVWSECPELRFGQLLVNVIPNSYKSDPFYVRDGDLIRHLDDFRASLRTPRNDAERNEIRATEKY